MGRPRLHHDCTECGDPHYAKGLCRRCYSRARYHETKKATRDEEVKGLLAELNRVNTAASAAQSIQSMVTPLIDTPALERLRESGKKC